MSRSRPLSRRRSSAFTLIELIVVLVIIAVLAAMIAPRIIGRTIEAKQVKAQSDMVNLSKALEQFRLDVGRYPSTEEGIFALRQQPADAEGWRGPYLTKDPSPDPWGREYVYEWPGSTGEESFALLTYGNDATSGGEGEAADIIESE